MPGAALLETAAAMAALAREYGATLLINDRADIAWLAGADGVHLGQDDLPPAAARALLGERATIGLSTHTVAQIAGAAKERVDYVAIGPVFGTATKETGYAAVGLEMVRRAVEIAAPRPVVAIGGITVQSAPSVIAAGASAVAVIGDLLATGDPARRAREFLDRLA